MMKILIQSKKTKELSIVGSVFTLTLVFLCLLMTSLSASALMVEAKGQAVIVNSLSMARETAYQDALRQASMSAGVDIYSETFKFTDGSMSDSVQLRSNHKITSSKIIAEEILNGILTVTIYAEFESAENSCQFTTSQYKKRIAATFFPIQHPEQLAVTDYYGIDKGISSVILKRLQNTGEFLTREANDINLYADLRQAPYISQETVSDDTLLTRFADRRNVQYVISGIIRDLSTDIEGTTLHRFTPFLPNFAAFTGTARQIESRNISIDFYLHDTLTGELLSQNSYTEKVDSSDVVPEHTTAFGTLSFFKTDFGQAFSKIIDQEVDKIKTLLSCRPFTMRVIDQKNTKLYLNAGISSKVKSGDILTVYTPDIPGEVFGIKGQTDQFGTPKTTLRIDKVYPAYSTAIPESGTFTQQDIINGYLIAW